MLRSSQKKLTDIFSESLKMDKFPNIINKAKVTSILKKERHEQQTKLLSSEHIIQYIKNV